jgi:alkylation response protein AidB-like acyl-CoA dehydrogenase
MSQPAHGLDIGRSLVQPTLQSWGTDEQRARFLPAIENQTEKWCQLFSEPGYGSDLAGLSTRAVLHDDTWHITGQKVWSTLAHIADWGILLARTDPDLPKHAGITCFILDMHQPGVTVRPLRQMTGRSDEFNEVFIDDAIVNDSLRVGPLGAGWKVSQTTLTSERGMLSEGATGTKRRTRVEQLISEAHAIGRWENAVIRNDLVNLLVHERVADLTNRRVLADARAGRVSPAAATGKLARSVLSRRIENVATGLYGARAMAWTDENDHGPLVVNRFLHAQCQTIIGGTSEIQRTIIGDRVLGLPREPAIDRDVPWSGLRR